ncbi:esterase E4 [Drosophila guanche]|uniref:Carboxylic ester hydrolase n=1 Tax=Drosophila guanche TaxID=7266 RepID=A0A3B0KH27_DROGU|nr:esterase E4 [Drosophila guanche]SPP85689.1 blast:Esterase E4 [Drosophila guanche]
MSFLLLLLVLSISSSFAEDPPVVELSLGRVQGSTMQSFQGKTIYAFRGIPYAQAPVGQLRFAPPQAATAWGPEEILKATSDSLVCPQSGISVLMSEDCLKVNVFTRNLEQKPLLLPVIVYIHGGANVLGSGHSLYEAGPQYLLDHEVLFVAFNYRLGALGFLRPLGSSVTGNFGFLDQVMALQWVRDHISAFGGDPDNVTLIGMSAGSMAVSLHLVSPLSRGLFHRAILMSGSATNHFAIDNVYWTQKLAREVGCPMFDGNDVVQCLRNVAWTRIVEVCKAWESYQFVNMKWNYEIDGHFLPRHPTELMAEGNFSQVPLLASFTANELDYTAHVHLESEPLLHDLGSNFEEYAPELFLYKENSEKSISRRLKEFYLGSNTSEISAHNIERFGNIFSDTIIGHGVHRLVQLARHFTPVYYMRTDYVGERSLWAPTDEQGKPLGMGHADDLQYVMPSLWYGTQMAGNHTDIFMMERLTKWFTHFAKTGTPLATTEEEEHDSWPPCNATAMAMLYNGVVPTLGPPAYAERYAIWDELFPTPALGGGVARRQQLNIVAIVAIALATSVASRLFGSLPLDGN